MSRPVSMPVLLEGWVSGVPAVGIGGLGLEASEIEPGQAYVHLGSGDPAQAESRGARAVIHDGTASVKGLGIPVVCVPDLARRIPELGARFCRHPSEQLKIAGVASPGGGSPVAHYIAQSWQRVNGGAGLIDSTGVGPFRNLQAGRDSVKDTFGLQLALGACLDADGEMAALEVTSRKLRNGWLDEVAFDVAVYPGSESAEDHGLHPLFNECRPRFAVIDHDTAQGKTLTRLVGEGVQVLTFGTRGSTELQGSVQAMDSTGMTLAIASPWGGGPVRTGLLGRENLSRLLAAAGALALMGMPWNRVMHQLEIMSAAPGQMSCVGGEAGQPAAVIDHARTPETLERALVTLRSHLHGRLYCVLNPAGRDRARMVQVAESFADRVYVTSRDARGDAIRRAIRACSRGDIVLVAGAGQESWSRSSEAVVRDLLEEAA